MWSFSSRNLKIQKSLLRNLKIEKTEDIPQFCIKLIFLVGAPIKVGKNKNPSEEEIGSVHSEYCRQLKALFEAHKIKFGLPETAQLEIV